MADDPILVPVATRHDYPTARLLEPVPYGYRLLAASVDRRLPFAYALRSRRKQCLIKSLKVRAGELCKVAGVREVTLFSAVVIPPGRGAFLRQRPGVRIARFDLVVFVETDTTERAARLGGEPTWLTLKRELDHASADVLDVSAANARNMGRVDHQRRGVFLFNFFYADDQRQNLAVWERTAGWFQKETGLDNSLLLRPDNPAQTGYSIINHCRWDRLRDILPDLLLKASFREYVLRYFEANRTAPMPILYRLA